MLFVRLGLGEIIVCLALVGALIIIPLALYWKTQRVRGNRDKR